MLKTLKLFSHQCAQNWSNSLLILAMLKLSRMFCLRKMFVGVCKGEHFDIVSRTVVEGLGVEPIRTSQS